MIFVQILSLFENLLNEIFSLFPSPTPPPLASEATTLFTDGLTGHFGWINDYIPIAQVVYAAEAVFAVWTVIWIIKATLWLFRLTHLGGGSD